MLIWSHLFHFKGSDKKKTISWSVSFLFSWLNNFKEIVERVSVYLPYVLK